MDINEFGPNAMEEVEAETPVREAIEATEEAIKEATEAEEADTQEMPAVEAA